MTNLAALIAAKLITPERAAELAPVADRYAVALTPAMSALIDPTDPADPIGLQFIPDARELEAHPAESSDPIGDHDKTVSPGLVHRYPDRVLLKLSGVCPVYCRFCFRREMVGPGAGTTLSASDCEKAFAYIAAHSAIWEVVLTGGDPLILSARRIREVTQALAAIRHVKVLRWHTRVPVVAPERITPDLIAALKSTDQAVYIAIHVNHARELTSRARTSLAALADAGIALVSQTVLLRGINDNVEALEALMRAFVECRVTPYYLHHGDLAPGTAHFRTTIAQGQKLMGELRARLSGLAQPTYVLDIPGAHGKIPIGAAMVQDNGNSTYTLTDPQGLRHAYQDHVSADASSKER